MSSHPPSVRARYSVTLLWPGVIVPTLLLADAAAAQQPGQDEPGAPVLATERYLSPPPAVAEAVLAPRWENTTLRNLDPGGRWFLRTLGDGLPPLSVFARPYHDLGELQIDPAASRARRLTTRSDVGYELVAVDASRRIRIEVPRGARVSGGRWSPDGTRLAFLAHFDDASRVYVARAEDGSSRRVTGTPLLATLVTDVTWTADGRSLVAVLPPEGRGPEPARAAVPETPIVRITTDEPNRLRTYFDLLENPYEIELVEYYTTGQLALIDASSGRIERIGEPAMIESVDASPDGTTFRVRRWREPFSYIVPTSSVGWVEELWDRDGQVLATVDEAEVRDGGDDGDDDEGGHDRRGLTWRVDGSGLVYLQREQRDSVERQGGEASAATEGEDGAGARKDRVVYWLPPYDSASTRVVYETEDRIQSFRFDRTGRTLFLTRRSGQDDRARERVTAVFLDAPDGEHEIYSHRTDDRLNDPGSLMSERGPGGLSVVRTTPDGGSVFLSGTRYFEDPLARAPRPFVDRVDARTGEKTRIFESAEDVYETVEEVLDEQVTRLVVSRESRTLVPDSWLLDLTTGERTRLTKNVDPTPDLTSARREIVMVTRPDGFRSKVEIALPADYREGAPSPAMFWFYPREYTDQEAYEERSLAEYNRNAFPRIGPRSMDILLRLGYAVVDPDLPIVGESGRMNDNYVQDLRNTLSAVIDTLAARGWIDRDRLAIGGHSYGAFGTVNAMVNTPFFKAGIAGDGNYNRSLTPAGFQSERRMLWEAEQVYIEMSPFFFADRLTGALLMYHGMDDHNVGTHPMHSQRLFHALNVLGKKAALYMYPFEDHGYATRETTLDLWARWVAWLDEYVKGTSAGPRVTTEEG